MRKAEAWMRAWKGKNSFWSVRFDDWLRVNFMNFAASSFVHSPAEMYSGGSTAIFQKQHDRQGEIDVLSTKQ